MSVALFKFTLEHRKQHILTYTNITTYTYTYAYATYTHMHTNTCKFKYI